MLVGELSPDLRRLEAEQAAQARELVTLGVADLTVGGDSVTLTTTAGDVELPADNDNGTYSALLTSAAAPGTAVITGDVNGAAIVDSARRAAQP